MTDVSLRLGALLAVLCALTGADACSSSTGKATGRATLLFVDGHLVVFELIP